MSAERGESHGSAPSGSAPGGPGPDAAASPGAPAAASRERSVAALLGDLSREVRLLFRRESELARAELREKLGQAGSGATQLGTGAMVSFAGVLVLLAAAVLGLDVYLRQAWLSSLIVGGAVTLIGLIMLARARSNLRAEQLAPERTMTSVQRDAAFARDQTRRETP